MMQSLVMCAIVVMRVVWAIQTIWKFRHHIVLSNVIETVKKVKQEDTKANQSRNYLTKKVDAFRLLFYV